MTIYVNECRAAMHLCHVATVKVIRCTLVDTQLMEDEREREVMASISEGCVWYSNSSIVSNLKLLFNSRNTSTISQRLTSKATWPWITGPVYMQTLIANFMGQHGVHLGPTGPRWAPCWPHKLCYLGILERSLVITVLANNPAPFHHWYRAEYKVTQVYLAR